MLCSGWGILQGGYTPLHIAALHGHRQIVDLLTGTYGAKENLRDYSGHLAGQYLDLKEPPAADNQLHFHAVRARERRNRKLTALFHSGGSGKKWGSVENLAPASEDRATHLALPAFRPRKFSR
ncbi:hypothetical protein AAFF_G00385880 [Aldrovandia affinis]|uniref:Uncharacterized protein n=1 Tax=Aldrovandia affinis TaxID=143900 RepID=A0AAD7SEZ0_9TELE|nr:hypothetical protein AAFF_G00385880 [Aldrovandia affinis]